MAAAAPGAPARGRSSVTSQRPFITTVPSFRPMTKWSLAAHGHVRRRRHHDVGLCREAGEAVDELLDRATASDELYDGAFCFHGF